MIRPLTILAVAGLAWSAPAATSPGLKLPPIGLWQGTYHCAQGRTALALQITAQSPTALTAVFYFHALASNPTVPPGCFSMRGRFDPATDRVTLTPTRWLSQPPFYVWTGLSGTMDASGAGLTGTIQGPACTVFALTRSLTPPVPPAPPACRLARNGPTV